MLYLHRYAVPNHPGFKFTNVVTAGDVNACYLLKGFFLHVSPWQWLGNAKPNYRHYGIITLQEWFGRTAGKQSEIIKCDNKALRFIDDSSEIWWSSTRRRWNKNFISLQSLLITKDFLIYDDFLHFFSYLSADADIIFTFMQPTSIALKSFFKIFHLSVPCARVPATPLHKQRQENYEFYSKANIHPPNLLTASRFSIF